MHLLTMQLVFNNSYKPLRPQKILALNWEVESDHEPSYDNLVPGSPFFVNKGACWLMEVTTGRVGFS